VFPLNGITVLGMRRFIEEHGGEAALRGKTTQEVCDDALCPATLASKLSWCEQRKAEEERALVLPELASVGPATVFVSHAWRYEFLNVVAALELWESRRLAAAAAAGTCPPSPPTSFWFDLFSNNQHGTDDRPFTWWTGCFRENIQRIGRTLLVLEWEDPKPLSSAWCTFEMAATLLGGGSTLEVVMNRSEEEHFTKSLVEDFERVSVKTCAVDVENGIRARDEEDLRKIREAIEDTIGFDRTTKLIIARMREWMVQAGRDALARMAPDERGTSNVLVCTAHLELSRTRYAEAAALYREALRTTRRLKGPDHPDTAVCMSNLGNALRSQGRLDESRRLYMRALEVAVASLGEDHPFPLTCLFNIAGLLQASGDLAQSLQANMFVLERRVRTLGEAHRDTLSSMLNAGAILYAVGRLNDAEQVLRRCLGIRTSAASGIHAANPDTLNVMTMLGCVLHVKRDLAGAHALLAEALGLSRRTCGDLHANTLGLAVNLGTVEQDLGLLREAEEHFSEAERGFTDVLGPDDAGTLKARSNRGMLLSVLGRLDEAVEVYTDVLAARRRIFAGGLHPDTLTSIYNLGKAKLQVGERREAEELLREAFEGRLRLLGPSHHGTVAAIEALRGCLETEGRGDEAVLLLKRAGMHDPRCPHACEGHRNGAGRVAVQG
jgi:tetratricopeptide (TPR) repeat protein